VFQPAKHTKSAGDPKYLKEPINHLLNMKKWIVHLLIRQIICQVFGKKKRSVKGHLPALRVVQH
jgi:hypothetical protein